MYPGDPTEQVLDEIYRIFDQSTLLDIYLEKRIYDRVPDNEKFPYMVLGPFSSSEHGSYTTLGFEGDLTVKVFSDYHGTKECQKILAEVFKLLDRKELPVPDLSTVALYRSFQDIFRESGDDNVYQGISKYKIVMGG